MEFIATSSEIKRNPGAYTFFNELKAKTKTNTGFVYFKYPIAGGGDSHLPDIVVVDAERGILFFDFFNDVGMNNLARFNEHEWTINGETNESPFLNLEDYRVSLLAKFQKNRILRNRVTIHYFAVFPQIRRKEISGKWPEELLSHCLFEDYSSCPYESLWPSKETNILQGDETRLFLSIAQGAGRLNDFKRIQKEVTSDALGDAIKLIGNRISLLDKDQHQCAIQIPDGPQRIRGMAGTGKTIVLTMKAALLHSRFPKKKILYTFHTQSLYNQIRDLITRFYRDSEEKDPDWDNLLVLHSWGSRAKEGVYYRTCLRNAIAPISFDTAMTSSPSDPLGFVCEKAINQSIEEEFDFVMIDEAQDFAPSFFQMIYKITKAPKRIVFAYDEMQSLNKTRMPDLTELFGRNPDGTPIVSFANGSYEAGIEMDYVLKKSYRNPIEILMVAHSIGLGIYNTDGHMQLVEDPKVWEAIGYELSDGNLKKVGKPVVIRRPEENSDNLVRTFYSGAQEIVATKKFRDATAEVEWLAEMIETDVKKEAVQPHDIVVISLNQRAIQDFYVILQNLLFKKGVPSIIPGYSGVDRDKFGEKGFVTLSTVFKAKGNEAFIVYICNFDFLYDYVEFVYARNRAFTSISRSKGWCRISGVGEKMARAIKEIKTTLTNIPEFKFNVPDPKMIARKLSQEEHARRLNERKRGEKALADLLGIHEDAVTLTKEQRDLIKKKLGL